MPENYATSATNIKRQQQVMTDNQRSTTREQVGEHVTNAIKSSKYTPYPELQKEVAYIYDIKLNPEIKEDRNTHQHLVETLPFYDTHIKTGTLSTMVENLASLIANDFYLEENGEQVESVLSLNNELKFIPNKKDIATISVMSNLYNEFAIVPYFNEFGDLQLNTLRQTKYLIFDNDFLLTFERGSKDRIFVTEHIRTETSYIMNFVEWRKKNRKWERYSEYEEQGDVKLYPVIINETTTLINEAIKENLLMLSELETSKLKEIKVTASTLVLNNDVLYKDTFDIYNNASVRVQRKSIDPTQLDNSTPFEIIQGTMRSQEYDVMTENITTSLSKMFKIDKSSLGLAPANSATEREQRELASRIRTLQEEINYILDIVVKSLTQKEDVVLKLVPLPEQTEKQLMETNKIKLEIGATTEFYLAKEMNNQADDDTAWEIALTKIIREGKVMTEVERAKALELGLIINTSSEEAIFNAMGLE